VAKILCVFVASWLNTKIAHFESIMQNKPNLLNARMNVGSVITKDYENEPLCRRGENKANTKPIKANFRKAKMKLNFYSTKDYENKPRFQTT